MSENNLVPVVVNNQPPTLADEQFSGIVDTLMDNAFSGFGAGLRILKPGKMSFKLIENRQEIDIPNGQVFGVLLGVAPCNYASWYARQYAPGQEPSRPDLVWMMPTADTFPDALPAEYHQKVSVNGQERWGFRIARRTVWALMTNSNGQFYLDLERPVVLDITSTSLYGNSDPRSNSYRWGGIKGFCDRHSQPGVFRCNPAMFVTQIILDPQSPVSGVMLFRPNLDPNGNPSYLDSQTYTAVIQTASTERIAEMLRVNEILTYSPNGAGVIQPVPAAVNIANGVQPMPQPMAQPAPQPVQQPMAQPVQQPVQQRLVIPEVFDHPRVGFRSKRYSVDDRGCIWHKSEKQDDGSWVTTDHILTTSQVYYIKSEWTYTNGVSERSHWFEVRHKHGAVELMRLPASTLASNQSLMAALNSSNILSCNLDMYTPKIFASFMNSYLRSVLENGYSTEIQTRDVFGWTDITDPVTNQPTLGFGVGHGVITDTGIHDMVYKGSAEKLAKKELSIKGDLDKWKYVPQMYRVLNQPAAQLAMCLSFAAPLMHYGPGVVRSAAYSLWSTTSGKGKSQVLCSAASIWGHPEEQFVQRNSSAVMRMRKMAVLNNLPVYMDELSDMKDEDLYALAYSLMGNQEKQKLKSNGAEMVDTGSWSTVTFITSNKCIKEAVARHAGDSEASIVRVMEYECDFPSYADKPEVQEYIHACMDACKTNYGLAGPEFIYQVLKHRDRLATLTQQVETWCRKYGFDNSERFLSYPLAMAMKAGRWAVEYGLLDYDMDALENWVINVFVPHNRRSTEANTTDPVHMLTTYLMERQLNMLVVRANHRDKTMPEQPHGVPDKYIVSLPNNRDITMRAVLATQELYISRSDLHKWLKAQKHSPSNLWKRLEDRGITAKDTTKNFGENIGWMQLPNTRCYRLDATSVKQLGFDIKDAPALEATANVKVL